MFKNGRSIKMILEFSAGCGICLLLVMLAPLSLWSDMGQAGSSLLVLATAMSITGVVLFRQRQAVRDAYKSHDMRLEPAE